MIDIASKDEYRISTEMSLQEQKIEDNDLIYSPVGESDKNNLSYQHIGIDRRKESSFTDGSSANPTLINIAKTIKLKRQIAQMKEKLDRSESNSIILKDEIQNLRAKLLAWLSRWQQVKTKKVNFKNENKYLVATNQEILK